MSSELQAAVAGATGALGAEILKVLDRVSWRPARMQALARTSTATTHVDYGEDRLPVDVADESSMEDVDVLFVATPAEAGGALVAEAARAGAIVVDCSGALLADPGGSNVPLIVPWVNPEALASVASGVVAIPSAEAMLLASVLGPWRRAGIVGDVVATVFVPASRDGREGIEELSRQVVALFNSATPPRKVFPEGLAFDLLPVVGEIGAEGWTDVEKAVVAQTRRVAGLEGQGAIDVSLVRVPVFSGYGMQLAVNPGRPVPAELALRVLADGGARLPEAVGLRYLPRPRRVEGKPFVHVGRVRVGASGALHGWFAMDNLRTVATAAVAAAGALLRTSGRLGDPAEADA